MYNFGRPEPAKAVLVFCEAGHSCDGFHRLGVDEPIKFCKLCGSATLYACRECGQNLVTGGGFLGTIPAPSFCEKCGKPFPWRARQLKRLKRMIAELAEVEEWDEESRKRAEELGDEIADDDISPGGIETAVRWLVQRTSEGAKTLIGEVIKSVATDDVKTYFHAAGWF